MWMNSGFLLILEPQMNPNTKSDCSSAICSCRKVKKKKTETNTSKPTSLSSRCRSTFRNCREVHTTAFVYSPVAREPWELICAMSRQPRPRGFPTALRPFTTPGPGTAWAFTMWDQEEIWYKPPGR